jgi:hypothetical protein
MSLENAKITKTGLTFEDSGGVPAVEYSSTSVKYNTEELINFSNDGFIDFKGNTLRSTGTPVDIYDVATKNYVDNLTEGLLIKEAVVAASTGNLNLDTAVVNNSTIDKVTVVTGDRVLIKDQTDKKENGVYVVKASGRPERSDDLDENHEFKNGVHVFVYGVTDNDAPVNSSVSENAGYVITTPADGTKVFTVGTNDIIWRRFSKKGVHTFNTGFTTVDGVDISIDDDYVTGAIDTLIDTFSTTLVGADGLTGAVTGNVGSAIDGKVLALNKILSGEGDPDSVGTIGDNTAAMLTNASAISDNAVAIGDNVTAIGDNATNIATNTGVLDTTNLTAKSMVFFSPDGKLETFNDMKYSGTGDGLIVQNLTCTSDRTKKTNIKTIENSNLIHQLRPVEYNWIDPKQDQRVKYGFIAQEVAEIFPSVVNKTDGVFGVEYINLISHLVMEMQTMRKELDELKK